MNLKLVKIDPNKTMRLNLHNYEYELLVKLLNKLKLDDDDFSENGIYSNYSFCKDSLLDKIQNVKQIDIGNKRIATESANKAKRATSKLKIENAINLLRLEDKKITVYAVAKISHLSYNTVKKYTTQVLLSL